MEHGFELYPGAAVVESGDGVDEDDLSWPARLAASSSIRLSRRSKAGHRC
jgi:hypothetical protein